MCECDEIENTSHFFSHCNLYGQLRHDLLDRVSNSQCFLYGNTDLTDVKNAELFSWISGATLYIKNKTFLLKYIGTHLEVLTKVAHTINQNPPQNNLRTTKSKSYDTINFITTNRTISDIECIISLVNKCK